MEKNIQFESRPEVQEWGNDKAIVPLNVKEVTAYDEEGNEVTKYQADMLGKVKKPVTQDTIVEAAVSEKYSDADRLRIMSNFTKKNDAEVDAFKAFTAEVREAAAAEGYE
jgi:hypothetical protein